MIIPDIPPEGLPLAGAPRYVLRKLLGRGGFGDAYLADDEELTRRVVIKLLMNLSDPTIRDRFKREARISANIRHPAVVQVFDIGSLPDGRPYFIMEWIDGTSLTQFIQERGATFSLSRSLTLLAEAAEGLAVAHDMGVIHRDIKPDNILVTRDGHAKLIDFGIAKKAVEESGQQTVKQTSMGTVLGTPRYISPEQAMAKVLAAASDLYSLGCVMYSLLTGCSPFEGSAQELMMHHVYTPAPTLAAAKPGRHFPPAVEGIVARLLAKDPLRRYQTGGELAKALRQVAEQARLQEEGDATATALPAIVEQSAPEGVGTLSNVHSASQPAAVDAPPAPFGQAGSFGASEGAATAALEHVAASPPPRKDESLSSRMPVTVMGEDLTGRTVSRHGWGQYVALAASLVVLIGAIVGAKFVFFPASTPSTPPVPTPTATIAPNATNESLDQPKTETKSPPTATADSATAPAVTAETTPPTSGVSPAPTAKATTTSAVATNKPKPPATASTMTAKPTATVAAPTVATIAKPSATVAPPPPPTGTLGAIDDRK